MKNIIIRKNKMFVIDKEMLKPKVLSTEAEVALYAALYIEFFGAVEKPEYSNLTNLEKFKKVNEFAYNWLSTRGLI